MNNHDIEFGVMLHTFGAGANPESFRQLATQAEDGGFDAVWVGDHITFPAEIPDTYPFSPDGKSPFDIRQDAYEAFQTLSYLASITDRVQLGTNACIVPYRHPAVLLRNVFTIEALSDGRFDFGAAPGWMESEFDVLDIPFEERGGRMDEFLQLFEQARTEGEVEFDGEYHDFQRTGFRPTPASNRPPIWIGGRSGASFRRVGQFGDGWTIFWDSPDEIRNARERLMAAWNDYNRSGTPEIAVVRPVYIGTDTDRDTNRLLIGDAESFVEDVRRYADAGTTRIVVDFFSRDTDDQLEQLRRLSHDVIPEIRQ